MCGDVLNYIAQNQSLHTCAAVKAEVKKVGYLDLALADCCIDPKPQLDCLCVGVGGKGTKSGSWNKDTVIDPSQNLTCGSFVSTLQAAYGLHACTNVKDVMVDTATNTSDPQSMSLYEEIAPTCCSGGGGGGGGGGDDCSQVYYAIQSDPRYIEIFAKLNEATDRGLEQLLASAKCAAEISSEHTCKGSLQWEDYAVDLANLTVSGKVL